MTLPIPLLAPGAAELVALAQCQMRPQLAKFSCWAILDAEAKQTSSLKA